MNTLHFYVAFLGQTAPQLDREWHLARASWSLCHGSCTPVREVIVWSDGVAGGAGHVSCGSQVSAFGQLMPFGPFSTWPRFGQRTDDLSPSALTLPKVPRPAALPPKHTQFALGGRSVSVA